MTLIIQQNWRCWGVSLKLYMAATHKRHKRGFVFILVIVLCVSYAAYILTEPFAAAQPTVRFVYSQDARSVSLSWPSFGEAAVGVPGIGVLDTHGSNTPQATASIAKVLTALAVLDHAPLSLNENGPLITLTQADLDSYNKYLAEDGSVVKVVLGEQITEYQALEAMLMPSANNIAETLARWAFGSIAAFNTNANQLAQRLDMTNTVITDPSGFLGTTVSTPHDLVLLGEAALANPVIAQIVAQPNAAIPIQGNVINVNILLGNEGIVGIKTGNNDQDPGCYLFAAHQTIGSQTITIVGAIMNGSNLGTTMWAALPLIKSTAANFSIMPIIEAGDPVARYTTEWGSQGSIIAQNNLSILAWKTATITASVNLQRLQAPISGGAQVGTLNVSELTSHTNYKVPLVLQNSINQPSILWRLKHSL